MRKNLPPYVAIKSGRVYFRKVWTDGGKRRERFVRLPDDIDSPEFSTEYWAIRSGTSEKVKPKQRDTWRELITAYRSSAKYRKLAAGTRKEYDRIMERILEKNADKSVRQMTRKALMDVHAKYADTPRKADWYIQVVRLLLNFAIRKLGWKIENVASGIDLYGKQREFEPWPAWMVKKLDTAPERVRSAAELILGTGQRPQAAILMRRDQFAGEWMTVTDEKSDEAYEVFCPTQLRAYIESLPVSGAYVIGKNLTQPVGYDIVEKAFRAWRKDLGERAAPYSLHGLRKLAIIRLAEAGCSDAQIQAITNQSAEMVAYYRRRANRKILSRAGHSMKERTGGEQ
ncbi:hypothetical protein PAF17_10400 [Paracoccus sp. Z330]|uniref:Tyr recombinase domain-containing protein n=1 Tax=Paracoccus onchidii TaxID=3017813 RepID=A0ABT4ZEV7_9RHOB|nr:tyrosine-type recombinase/integrase [Paracoccus onchidii]MDB6177910.1 hypothetical protein [Paracoccus onchidii]